VKIGGLGTSPRLLRLPMQTQIELFVIINHAYPEPVQEAKPAQDIEGKGLAFCEIDDSLPLKAKD